MVKNKCLLYGYLGRDFLLNLYTAAEPYTRDDPMRKITNFRNSKLQTIVILKSLFRHSAMNKNASCRKRITQ